jgi:hypothetical protein
LVNIGGLKPGRVEHGLCGEFKRIGHGLVLTLSVSLVGT